MVKKNERSILRLFLAISAMFISTIGFTQTIEITGRVTETDTGEPLATANVVVKGTNIGVMTDDAGYYTLPNVPSSAKSLEFHMMGYDVVEVAIDGKTVINVSMSISNMLDETVVVGFGRQKKESVVGAIQTINPKELKVPSSNLSNAFAGKLSGVIAVQRTGEPGADGSSFWIRGISTFAGATSPLIFIDGVEVDASDMNALAPEVIEGFSILKDATATALYGARGANGVMLITTRQGKKNERARINLRFEGQLTTPTRIVDIADGVDYMALYNEARLTRGIADLRFPLDKIKATREGRNPLLYPNVDWQETLFKDYSANQTMNMNVTGGGNRVTYFMSASLNNDNGMLRKDPQNVFDNNIKQLRFSFQGNIGVELTNTTKATLRLNTQVIDYNGSHKSASTLYNELFYAPGVLFQPYYPNTIEADHTLFGNQEGGPHPQFGVGMYRNPYAQMVTGYNERNENANIVTFELEQKLDVITQGLSAKGLISFKNWSRTNVTRDFTPTYYQITSFDEHPDGSYDYEINALNQGKTALSTSSDIAGDRLMNIQLMVDYTRSFNKHDVGGMVVYLQRDYNNNNPGSDYYATLPERNQGLAGRATYGYDGRYLFEANFGYNGSENFQDGKRFGFFPSFAAGYNISNEQFWQPIKKVVSNLKLRGSWGIVGNASIGGDARFPYLTFVNLSGKSYQFGNNWQTSQSGASITRYGAVGAQWEEGKKVNVGLDLTLFNSLSIVADFFQEKREGIFMRRRTIPTESGISGDLSPYANLGKVTNKGFDISLDYNKAFLNNELIVNVRGSFTYTKNNLDEKDEPNYEFEYMSEVGKSLNLNKGLVALGLFKDQAEIDASPRQSFSQDVMPGDIKYKDMNGDGQIDANDRTLMGDPSVPQIVYGFGFSAQYKGFDASLFFQGVAKTSILMNGFHPFESNYSQLYQFIADDYWSEANPNPYAEYPRLVQQTTFGEHNNHQHSDFWIRNGSFLRLKNVEVGYTYKFARLYISGQNLLTFSKFKYWDPEIGSGNGLKYPTLRTYSVGLQFTF